MHGRNSFSTSKLRHIQIMTKCENLKDKTFTFLGTNRLATGNTGY